MAYKIQTEVDKLDLLSIQAKFLNSIDYRSIIYNGR